MNMYSDVRDGITGSNWSRTSRYYLAVSNYTQVAKPLTSVRPTAAAVRTAYLTGKTARPFTRLLTIYCQHYSLQ
jgi:hypothetical protein